ncbi:hypothetical protein [Actinoplanes sp. M2I2]|uniref:hypothetical protein n=1 Tax=Actinoplanes sp. M2I2 TaxID=1734444 RepID=UPI0020225E10|nr:hypothetical protein [Actinoplanes sp. M2I2]
MDDALERMRLAAALWSVEGDDAAELVDAACALLVAGHDGDNVAILAGVMRKDAEEEAPALLEAALRDVGLEHYAPDAHEAQRIAVRHLASQAIAGELVPADFLWRAIGSSSDFADRLFVLGREYLSDHRRATQLIDADVLAEAHRLLDRR